MCSLASCKHEHKWGKWQVETPAMVLTDGLEYRTCKCGEREVRSVDKVGLENALLGHWKSSIRYDTNMFLSLYSDKSASFYINVSGVDLEYLFYTYEVEGEILTMTSMGSTPNVIFRLEDCGSYLKIIDENGYEFLRTE